LTTAICYRIINININIARPTKTAAMNGRTARPLCRTSAPAARIQRQISAFEITASAAPPPRRRPAAPLSPSPRSRLFCCGSRRHEISATSGGSGGGGSRDGGGGGRGGGDSDSAGPPGPSWQRLLASVLVSVGAAGALYLGSCPASAASPALPAYSPEELERLTSMPSTT
jgi:hypothetical protein